MEDTGSYRIPNVEHAHVSDAMNKVTCSRDAGLREMGRLMASEPTGMISALDIAGIVGWGEG